MFVGFILIYSRLYLLVGSAKRIRGYIDSVYSLEITSIFLVCETFGQPPETNSSDKTSPSSGDSSIPLTFSFISIKLILGRSFISIFLFIQPLSIRISSFVSSNLKGVKTLYPAIPLLIVLSINIC